MQREEYEFNNIHRWICMCGASNGLGSVNCAECKIPRNEYPKKMNCHKCDKVLYDFKKDDVCIHCGTKY
jgi:hypothetical protein